ncbi:MAG: UpxY family transcription antiterminator [Clostridium sp.]|nr:UpxY family transcription antiterminator [Clostridium sp.]
MNSGENISGATPAADEPKWFALRDLSRPNALKPGYMLISDIPGIEIFTPMKWRIVEKNGKSVRKHVPVIHDLLFARSTRPLLDPVVEDLTTIQYRFVKGGGYREPLTIPTAEMERFIRAVNGAERDTLYYANGELTPDMIGRTVRIVGGPLDGYEGRLLSIRGMRVKRLLVELPGFLTAAVEVAPEYIQFVK